MTLYLVIKNRVDDLIYNKVHSVHTQRGYLIIYFFNKRGFYTANKIPLSKISGMSIENEDNNIKTLFDLKAIKEIKL